MDAASDRKHRPVTGRVVEAEIERYWSRRTAAGNQKSCQRLFKVHLSL